MKPLGNQPVHRPDAHQHDAEGGQHPPRTAQSPHDRPAVEEIAAGQEEVDITENAVFLSGVLGPQEQRTHHRTERQRDNSGDDHRHGDRDGELPVELPVMPERKLTGTNTAQSTKDMAISAPPRLRIAFFVAS